MKASRIAPLTLLALCIGLPWLGGCSSDDDGAKDPQADEAPPQPSELRAKIGPGGGELVGQPNTPFSGERELFQ